MSKYTELFEYIEEAIGVKMPERYEELFKEVKEFFENSQEKDKSLFTENGLLILEFLQKSSAKNFKAKDISEGMEISSRKVSGAMRKLVNDGWCDKFGSNPVIYSLTQKGKEIDLNSFKESLEQSSEKIHE